MFATAWEAMTKARRQCVLDLLTEIAKISSHMFKAAENKLGILFDSLDASLEKDGAALDEGTRIKQAVRLKVLEWGARWRNPAANIELSRPDNFDIPEAYFENVTLYEHQSEPEDEESELDD